MNATRLFRTVWRVNGVLILGVFLLAGGAAAVGLVAAVVSRVGGDDRVPVETEGDEHLAFGLVEQVDGTPHVILPLAARQPGMSYSSDGAAVTRNLLFYDASSHAARWLRPDHRGAVVSHELLRETRANGPGGADDEESGPVRWIRYEIADRDTDGDGAVTDEDVVRVAVSGPGGEGLSTVVGDADEILGYAPPRGGVLLVFFRRGEESLVADVDLATGRLRKTTPLPVR
jgi:hypothetical protein